MRAFELSALAAARSASGRPCHEFLREGAMSLGIHVLPAEGSAPIA